MCENPKPMLLMGVRNLENQDLTAFFQASLTGLRNKFDVMIERPDAVGNEDFMDMFVELLQTKEFERFDSWDPVLESSDTIFVLGGVFCETCGGPRGLEWSSAFEVNKNVSDEARELITALERKSGTRITPLKLELVKTVVDEYVEDELASKVGHAILRAMLRNDSSKLN